MESVANWSDLPPEMLVEMAIKLKDFEDFTAFRGVCTLWRAAAAKDIFKGTKLPLLMLSDYYYRDCKFYSLSTKKIRKAAVPEAEGKRCSDARFGWILATVPDGVESYLFKPFSSFPTIPLPRFPAHLYTYIVTKAILTANPSETSDFMLVMLMDSKLQFWKNGGNSWNRIELECPNYGFKRIGYCGHKMYAIDYDRRLLSWDPSATQCLTRCQLVLTLSFLPMLVGNMALYMMESTAGELLVITRERDYSFSSDIKLQVFRIDVAKREWKVINGGMGKEAVFCSGLADAVSVDANDFAGLIQPNSIYFEYHGYMQVFENKRIQRLDAKSYHSMWVFP